MMKILLGLLLVLLIAAGAVVYVAGMGWLGEHEAPGQVTQRARPSSEVAALSRAVAGAAEGIGVARPKQILFGDLHVHTTFSFDAFTFSLPIFAGEGAHPPADACDFARFCSALDFWSINDHAFSITPAHWRETVDSIRQCNDVAAGQSTPDTVAFLGWEWTQVGPEPENHYGHKNVVLRGTSDDEIPARPIAAMRGNFPGPGLFGRAAMSLSLGGRFSDLARYYTEWESTPYCAQDVASPDLPNDCIEHAPTPADLFRKLDEWDADAIVIPHGTTWGFYTPPGSTWDKQLRGPLHSEARQTLIELYSGHGDSEVYRSWRAVELDASGEATCPAPTPDYEPTCWRAGEIIRARCLELGESEAECERRAVEARANAAAARVAVHRTVPGSRGVDFLDAGQCRDCREPSFNYRPGGSAQYILALSNFEETDEEGDDPRRFRMGFMSSSDNHYARPGTGYKEVHRAGFTESQSNNDPDSPAARLLGIEVEEPQPRSRPFQATRPGFDIFETERQASFLLTGGLIATHAEGRDRQAIWGALQRREVYGTSGPRILLWFDLINAPGSRGQGAPMGSEIEMNAAPIFQARAVGSFEQAPGCPEYAERSLGAERLAHVCKDECYNPTDRRRPITRIEIVRIRPQASPDEDIASLIDDPWLRFDCDPDPGGCVATFTDPDFARGQRDSLYYVRAFEAPAPAINAGNLRCQRGASGACASVQLCPGPEGQADDCLATHEPRAWSSPIWVDWRS